MSTVAATPPATSNSQTPAAASRTSFNGTQPVSITEFMQLLSAEMSNQDPMQPMDPTQTLTQLAQFTSVQQTNQLVQSQSLSAANSYLGLQVTIPSTTGGAPTTGIVGSVDSSQVASGGAPQLLLSGSATEYPITSISQVQLAPPPPTPTSSSGNAASSSTGSTGASPSTGTPTSGGSTPPPASTGTGS